MTEPNDLQVFSSSSIQTFLRCAKQWEFAYVYAIRRPPRLRMVIGLAAHEAVEVNYRQKMGSGVDLPLGDVTDAFSDAYDRLVVEAVIDAEDDETPGAGKDSGVQAVGIYHKEVSPSVQPLMVEEQVQFKLNGVPFSGFIDVVDQRRRIRDLKTVKKKPGRNDYLINMIGYAVGFRHKTGETEGGVLLDYVVRTKRPYHHPVPSDGPVPAAAVAQFADIVEGVARAVRHGTFLPTGLTNNACSWCGYQDICDAYQRTR